MFDMRMRGGAAHRGGEEGCGTVGKQQAACEVEVGAHAFWVDDEPGGERLRLPAGCGGEAEQGGDRLPLRMPCASRALMCGGHRVQQGRHVARRL